MKAKIIVAFITALILLTLLVFGFIVYLFPKESIVCIIAASAFSLVLSTWKIVFNSLDERRLKSIWLALRIIVSIALFTTILYTVTMFFIQISNIKQ